MSYGATDQNGFYDCGELTNSPLVVSDGIPCDNCAGSYEQSPSYVK